MCRLAAFFGPTRPLADIVIAPNHSLVAQSQEAQEAILSVNGDGFGMAWYGDQPEPGLYRDVLPAWSDSNLLSLCTHISAPLFLAHVRASTEGETSRVNCHPFTHDRWSFMHNGQTGSFSMIRRQLEARLSNDLYARRKGSTDSELLFLLLLNEGLDTAPELACQRVLRLLQETTERMKVRPFFRQTCVFTNGEHLYCYRYASDARHLSLYVSRRFATDGIVLASEPLDTRTAEWTEVTPNPLHRFSHKGEMVSNDIAPEALSA